MLIKYLFYFIAKGRFSSNGRRGRTSQQAAADAARGVAVDGFAAAAPRKRCIIVFVNYCFKISAPAASSKPSKRALSEDESGDDDEDAEEGDFLAEPPKVIFQAQR